MKKIKIFSVVLLICSAALLAAFLMMERANLDQTPPVIKCPVEELHVSIHTPEDTFLEGVSAMDDRTGDVTDALVVEKISVMAEDGSRTVTYAVIDEAGNVGRAQRQLTYTDYRKPRFYFDDDLRLDHTTQLTTLLDHIQADSSIDGDLTDKIKFMQTDDSPLYTTGPKKVELRVTDSAGTTATLPVTVELYQPEREQIRVKLKSYLLYLPQGADIDAKQQFLLSEPEGVLSIEGSVDTQTPGVYELDYVVRNGTQIGRSRLVVVVEAPGSEGVR